MYQYILFDLDGTLTDPASGILHSLRYALKTLGVQPEDDEKLKLFIGPPLTESFPAFCSFDQHQTQEAIRLYREHQAREGLYDNKVFPGVQELLEELCAAGKDLFVATTKMTTFAEEILTHFNLRHFFRQVVGGNQDGTRTAKVEIIGDILQSLPQDYCGQAVMVGDRKFDLIGARVHQVDTIAVTYGYGSLDELTAEKPTHLVNSVAALAKLLLQK